MWALLFVLTGAAAQCYQSPPCPRIAGFASHVENSCCKVCIEGFACNGTHARACNATFGAYQPQPGMAGCLTSPRCTEFIATLATATSPHVCGKWSTCDPIVQYEVAAPTLTTDRKCACISTHIGSPCHACSTLIEYCSQCVISDGSPACTVCWSGYSIASDNPRHCLRCNVPNCVQCLSNGLCSTCADGYRSINGQCVCSVEGCSTCDSSTCLSCISPLVLAGNTCVPCAETHLYTSGKCVLRTTTMQSSSATDTTPPPTTTTMPALSSTVSTLPQTTSTLSAITTSSLIVESSASTIQLTTHFPSTAPPVSSASFETQSVTDALTQTVSSTTQIAVESTTSSSSTERSTDAAAGSSSVLASFNTTSIVAVVVGVAALLGVILMYGIMRNRRVTYKRPTEEPVYATVSDEMLEPRFKPAWSNIEPEYMEATPTSRHVELSESTDEVLYDLATTEKADYFDIAPDNE